MAYKWVSINVWPMEPNNKPSEFTVAFLHGALASKNSMRPIAQAILAALPGAQAKFIELPGHGQRAGQPVASFALDDLAADALSELRREIGNNLPWSRVGLVGESTGALVFARMIATLPEPPAFALFGEPPLSSRPYMSHVEAELAAAPGMIARKMASELFKFDEPEVTSWHQYFMELSCPSLLVYGECREDNTPTTERPPVLSIIGPKDIEALRHGASLVTVGVEGRGHRLLQTMPGYWASMLRGVLASSGHESFRHTRIKR